jgi:hypothetical protein
MTGREPKGSSNFLNQCMRTSSGGDTVREILKSCARPQELVNATWYPSEGASQLAWSVSQQAALFRGVGPLIEV